MIGHHRAVRGRPSPAAVKVGSRLSAAFSLTTGRAASPALEPLARRRPAPPARPSIAERALRVGVRDHGPGRGSARRFELDALARQDRGRPAPRGEPAPASSAASRDRERDRVPCRPRRSPTPDPSPSRSPWWCMSLTDAVPGSRGPGVRPDHALAEERVLEPLVVDVAVERLGDRLLEHDRDQLLVVAQHLLDLVAARRATRPGVAARPIAEQPPQAAEHLLVGEQPLDVGLVEPVRRAGARRCGRGRRTTRTSGRPGAGTRGWGRRRRRDNRAARARARGSPARPAGRPRTRRG